MPEETAAELPPMPKRPRTMPGGTEPPASEYARGRQFGVLEHRVNRIEADVLAISQKMDGQARDLTAKLDQQAADFDSKLSAQTATLTTTIENRFTPLSAYIDEQRAHEAERATADKKAADAKAIDDAHRKEQADKRDKKVDQLMVIGITMLGSLAVTQLPPLFAALAGTLPAQQMALVRIVVVAAIIVAIVFAVWARRGGGGEVTP